MADLPCKFLTQNGDCLNPDLDSDHHACVAIKFKDECPLNPESEKQIPRGMF